MSFDLPDEEVIRLRKLNRLKKLSPKKHKIAHESGRSTKSLYRRIITRGKSKSQG